jgi:hypothetical protein
VPKINAFREDIEWLVDKSEAGDTNRPREKGGHNDLCRHFIEGAEAGANILSMLPSWRNRSGDCMNKSISDADGPEVMPLHINRSRLGKIGEL